MTWERGMPNALGADSEGGKNKTKLVILYKYEIQPRNKCEVWFLPLKHVRIHLDQINIGLIWKSFTGWHRETIHLFGAVILSDFCYLKHISCFSPKPFAHRSGAEFCCENWSNLKRTSFSIKTAFAGKWIASENSDVAHKGLEPNRSPDWVLYLQKTFLSLSIPSELETGKWFHFHLQGETVFVHREIIDKVESQIHFFMERARDEVCTKHSIV